MILPDIPPDNNMFYIERFFHKNATMIYMEFLSHGKIRIRKVAVNNVKVFDSRLFTGLSETELNGLMQATNPSNRKFKRGATIWREGDVVDGVGVLESGTLFCQRYHTDGKVQLVRLFLPGDILNIEAAVSHRRTSPTNVIATTTGNYIWFSTAKLFKNPEVPEDTVRVLQTNLLAYLADEAIRFIKKSDILSRRTVRDRITMYLNVLREQYGNEFDTGMTQEELAQFLCVDRSSLSEELNKMRRDGLIDFNRKAFRLFFD